MSEAEREAVKVQISQNVHAVNEAVTSLLRPFSQATLSAPLSAQEITEIHKQCAPQVLPAHHNTLHI